ncbi:MAG: D-alanine--D-alanine ligase family protein [Pyramidobacter sp.]|nr:D-alanine--D-alanine ligase family protein [Pyramidobacter sp.]
MTKKKIAVIFGGHSSEYEVSLQSAATILKNADRERLDVIPIGITREGDWYRYSGTIENVEDGSWVRDAEHLHPVVFSQNRSVRGFLEFHGDGSHSAVALDLAFPMLHGKNGEDGTVQGLLELAGIPVVGCGVLASALCMDKGRAYDIISHAGISIPKSVIFSRHSEHDALKKIEEQLTFPVFVKPVRAGSSVGVTKVSVPEDLPRAVEYAFEHDFEVLVEEQITGLEIGCAVLGTDAPVTGRVDEVVAEGEFFTYRDKYLESKTRIYTPARIDEEKENEVRRLAVVIYTLLGCAGFARVDLFLRPDGEIVFNEVNTIPGFTSHSRYPTMMNAVGISVRQVIDTLVELAEQK